MRPLLLSELWAADCRRSDGEVRLPKKCIANCDSDVPRWAILHPRIQTCLTRGVGDERDFRTSRSGPVFLERQGCPAAL
jgi:hypothetical protein